MVTSANIERQPFFIFIQIHQSSLAMLVRYAMMAIANAVVVIVLHNCRSCNQCLQGVQFTAKLLHFLSQFSVFHHLSLINEVFGNRRNTRLSYHEQSACQFTSTSGSTSLKDLNLTFFYFQYSPVSGASSMLFSTYFFNSSAMCTPIAGGIGPPPLSRGN